eukprot:6473108-Amphidinium_carterae.1
MISVSTQARDAFYTVTACLFWLLERLVQESAAMALETAHKTLADADALDMKLLAGITATDMQEQNCRLTNEYAMWIGGFAFQATSSYWRRAVIEEEEEEEVLNAVVLGLQQMGTLSARAASRAIAINREKSKTLFGRALRGKGDVWSISFVFSQQIELCTS